MNLLIKNRKKHLSSKGAALTNETVVFPLDGGICAFLLRNENIDNLS